MLFTTPHRHRVSNPSISNNQLLSTLLPQTVWIFHHIVKPFLRVRRISLFCVLSTWTASMSFVSPFLQRGASQIWKFLLHTLLEGGKNGCMEGFGLGMYPFFLMLHQTKIPLELIFGSFLPNLWHPKQTMCWARACWRPSIGLYLDVLNFGKWDVLALSCSKDKP